jgi:hypothetical protein
MEVLYRSTIILHVLLHSQPIHVLNAETKTVTILTCITDFYYP